MVLGLNPGGGEIFRTCPDRPWGPPILLYNGYMDLSGGKERPGRDSEPHPLLVPWSRKGRAIPLLPPWAVRPVQSLSACTRVQFTLYFRPIRTDKQWNMRWINPLNPELNPIFYLLALLAHHFLHVSRIRVKSLTLRLLMSYIYGAHILDVSRSHTTTHHSR